MAKTNTTEFLRKLLVRFPDNVSKYDYSGLSVDGMTSRINYLCKICGHTVQGQLANDHYQGYGCPSCAKNLKYSKSILISKSKEKFGDRFDFTQTEDFVGKSTKIKIGCPVHGQVDTSPLLHLKSVSGCSLCYRYDAEELKQLFYKNPYNSKSSLPYIEKELEGRSKLRYLTVRCHYHGEYKAALTSVASSAGCKRCSQERSAGVYTRSLADKNKTELLNTESGIYLFHLKSAEINCYKIGVTNNINRRFAEIVRHSKCDATLLYYGKLNAYDAVQIEQDVLDHFKTQKYVSPYTFSGCTELFYTDDNDKLSELIEFLSKCSEEERLDN